MRTYRLLLASSLVLAVVAAVAVYSAAQPTPKPFSKDDVVKLLTGNVPVKRVEALVHERGIDFQITPETEAELRKAGANDPLLVALSFAKNRSHCFSGCTTHPTSQSGSSISGSSQRSTSIEWCWKSNQRQKTSKPRSRGQVCSSRNQPANCATKISSHNFSKTSRTSCSVSHSGIRWIVGSRAKSRSVSLWLVGSAVCSQSRNGCLGFTTMADRFSMTHP
jgi:hypothetical protein